MRALHEERRGAIGLSSVCSDPAAFVNGFEEARHALTGAAVLGRQPARRRLRRARRTSTCCGSRTNARLRDATVEAVGRLAAYDEQRQTQLLLTLEEFSAGAATSARPPRRFMCTRTRSASGFGGSASSPDLDLRGDDWLEIEIAVKLVLLRRASPIGHTWPVASVDSRPVNRASRRGTTVHPRRRGAVTVPENERLEKIRKDVADRGIEFFFAQFVDLHARPSAKLIPAANLDDLVNDGAGFAGFAAGDIGQAPSDPDIAAIPDLDSFTPVPWEPTVARFACDITVEGEPWP